MGADLLTLRPEIPSDYLEVENLTREAFWNVYAPGCVEHYLLHRLRCSSDFIPELDIVAERDGRIVGNVVCVSSRIDGDNGKRHEVLTLGPISVLPSCQRIGIGRRMIGPSCFAEILSYMRGTDSSRQGSTAYGHLTARFHRHFRYMS